VEAGIPDLPCVGRGWSVPEALEDLARALREHAVEVVLAPALDGETAA